MNGCSGFLVFFLSFFFLKDVMAFIWKPRLTNKKGGSLIWRCPSLSLLGVYFHCGFFGTGFSCCGFVVSYYFDMGLGLFVYFTPS